MDTALDRQTLAIPGLVVLHMAPWLGPFFTYHFYTGDPGDSIPFAIGALLAVFLLATAVEFAPAWYRLLDARVGRGIEISARDALCQLLARHLGCQANGITLRSAAGQAIRLDRPGTAIGLSVSHEPGLSVLAIHLAGPIGIDLLQITEAPVWQHEIPHLARDHLGPEIADRLAAQPLSLQTAAFGQAWTTLESRLKCRHRELQE